MSRRTGASLPAAVLLAAAAGCASVPAGQSPAPAGSSAGVSSLPAVQSAAPGVLKPVHDPGQVTGVLTGPCYARGTAPGQLPDPRCTPGSIDPAVTRAGIHKTICVSGYTRTVRPPEPQTARFKFSEAYPAYGLAPSVKTELDHLVPLELGGSNSALNLWPEIPPSFNPKDAVEGKLHAAVCSGKVTLPAAQNAVAADWTTAERVLGISS